VRFCSEGKRGGGGWVAGVGWRAGGISFGEGNSSCRSSAWAPGARSAPSARGLPAIRITHARPPRPELGAELDDPARPSSASSREIAVFIVRGRGCAAHGQAAALLPALPLLCPGFPTSGIFSSPAPPRAAENRHPCGGCRPLERRPAPLASL